MNDLSGKTALVVGASRGLGHGIATALAEAGASVIAVARNAVKFPEPSGSLGAIQSIAADAADAAAPGSLLDQYDPEILILVAGASPLLRPLQLHTWETFSANWNTDVRIAFHWLREAVRAFLARVVLHTPDQWRLTYTRANGAPAFAMYKRAPDGSFRASGLDVLSLVSGRIARIVAFNDPTLVAKFGLPQMFPEPPTPPSAAMT
jgi:NAD(P)-dependent dehydrogenase (short-subunit alcohol dehydrogenase family)